MMLIEKKFRCSRRRKMQRDDHYIQAAEWKKVESGGKMPFFFHNKEKNRHEVLCLINN